MSWEALTAIATAFTGIVIAATVVVGARQLSLTRDTLDELRRATQLEGTMRVLDDLMGPEFRAAMLFVTNELPQKCKTNRFERRFRVWERKIPKRWRERSRTEEGYLKNLDF
jgi:hypothetical protein